MTGEEVNRTRSMGSPRSNKKTEQEETWHCSRLDGASEFPSALMPAVEVHAPAISANPGVRCVFRYART